jgi:glycosyltransferase involved in cell wall biosynthesis
VVVVPLRVGGGTRLKILEAMAMEKPVVSTSIGAEGLMFNADDQLFIADNEQDFGEKVNLLIKDRNIAYKMAKSAKVTIIQKYDWNNIRESATKTIHQYNIL